MATSGQLIAALAATLGLPAKTVLLHDRILSEAGMRSKKGRGRNAATMSARDAANLLIAAISTPVSGPSVKSSLSQWSCYSALTASGGSVSLREPRRNEDLGTGKWKHPSSEVANLTELSESHSLVDAVSALISFNICDIVLKVSSPTPAAELFVGNANGYEVHYYISEYYMGQLNFAVDFHGNKFSILDMTKQILSGSHGRTYGIADLQQVRWVSGRTIKALADTIHVDPDIG